LKQLKTDVKYVASGQEKPTLINLISTVDSKSAIGFRWTKVATKLLAAICEQNANDVTKQ